MFDSDSRYTPVDTYEVTDAKGRPVTIKKIRFIPPTPADAMRRIAEPDRPDLIAHEFYKAPHLSWRIADANEVMDPAELVAKPGALVKIPPHP